MGMQETICLFDETFGVEKSHIISFNHGTDGRMIYVTLNLIVGEM